METLSNPEMSDEEYEKLVDQFDAFYEVGKRNIIKIIQRKKLKKDLTNLM